MTVAARVAPLALSPQAELIKVKAEIVALEDAMKRARGRLIKLKLRVDVLADKVQEQRAC
jgi:hypothetical protein